VEISIQNKLLNKFNGIVRRWGWKVLFSFIDQGMFSGANFIINILLARWLQPEGYGAYAFGFSVFLFISGIQSAVVLEPMAIFGSTRHDQNQANYFSLLIICQFILTLILGVVLGLLTLFVDKQLQPALLGVAISCPFILLIWLVRQACYVQTRTSLAMQASIAYAIVLIIGSFVFKTMNLLSPFSVYLLMSFSSVIAIIIPSRSLGIHLVNLQINKGILKDLAYECWKYGKWILLASIASWIATSIYVPLITVFSGLSQAAAFRSMQNLTLPLQQLLSALYLILLPYIARQKLANGKGYLRKTTNQVLLLFSGIVLAYSAVIIMFSHEIIKILYGNSFYQSFIWLIPCLSAVTFITIFSQVFSLSLRVMQKPDAILWAKIGAALMVVTAGIFAIRQLGLIGVILCIGISAFAEAFIARGYYKIMVSHND
jgi:O-antigen/teichoic acid export membrane protein